MLVQRARALCNKESLHDKLGVHQNHFQEKGYSITQIWQALNLAVRTSKPNEKHTLIALPANVQMTNNPLNGIPAKTTINVLACHLGRYLVSFILWRTTWDWGLWGFTAYPAVWSGLYQTHWLIYRDQNKRAAPHIRPGYPDKSVVAEHRFNHKHVIKFQDTQILSTVPGKMEQLNREKWSWSSTLTIWTGRMAWL